MFTLTILFLVPLAYFLLSKRKRLASSFDKTLSLPPGPPRKPLIGNLLDLSTQNFWVQASKWAEQYGDVVYLDVLGQPIIFLDSEQAAIDLLEKRSANYSDRLRSTMLQLIDVEWGMGFTPYGNNWRTSRRIFINNFTAKAVVGFQGTLTKYSRILLQRLDADAEKFSEHIMQYSAGIIMDSIYGIDVGAFQENITGIARHALDAILEAGTPGAFLVDFIPWLKYWPAWAWGGGFQKKARAWKKLIYDFKMLPFNAAVRLLDSEKARPNFVSSWMTKIASTDLEDHNLDYLIARLQDAAGSAFAGGFETTSSTLTALFLAMLIYPEVQVKAQEELDRVIGRDRLPDFSDRNQLPYVNAICLELLRWQPIVPFGLPHRSMKDDEYHGMLIPKGSLVIANSWSMLRNEKVYGPNVKDFIPERFLKEGIKEPSEAFGFGRRICPGRYFLNQSLFIAISSIMHLCSITKPADHVGEIENKWTSGVAVRPMPFRCSIKARFPNAFGLVERIE